MLTISELARGLGYSRQYMQRCVKEGCPLDDFESARLWFQANRPQTRKKPKMPAAEETIAPLKKNGQARDLDKVLTNAAIASENAWLMLEEAFLEGKVSKITTLLNLHSKAVEARVKAEAMIRAELERQKILIPSTEAQGMIRKVVEIIISRLSAMPQNLAARVNPSSPGHAVDILQDECTAIIQDAQKAVMS